MGVSCFEGAVFEAVFKRNELDTSHLFGGSLFSETPILMTWGQLAFFRRDGLSSFFSFALHVCFVHGRRRD